MGLIVEGRRTRPAVLSDDMVDGFDCSIYVVGCCWQVIWRFCSLPRCGWALSPAAQLHNVQLFSEQGTMWSR